MLPQVPRSSVFSIIVNQRNIFLSPCSFYGAPEALRCRIHSLTTETQLLSGAEHCSCLIAHSNITQMEEKAKCVRSVLSTFLLTLPFSTLSQAFSASFRQFQTHVFPTDIWRFWACRWGSAANLLLAGLPAQGSAACCCAFPPACCWMDRSTAGAGSAFFQGRRYLM